MLSAVPAWRRRRPHPIALATMAMLLACGASQAADRWLSVDKAAGRGVYVWDTGMRYEGGHVDGKREGQGVLTWPSGHRFEGTFVNNEYTTGRMQYPGGETYEGGFAGGRRAGRGVYTWPNGNRYEGEFRNDQFNGKGVYTWFDGARYEGDFADNLRNGQGVMVEKDGSRYEGAFLSGKRSGIGRERYASGQTYEGGHLNGVRSGQGVFTWPSGNRYEGGFLAGLSSGRGRFTFADGGYLEGEYLNDELNGKGVRAWPDGARYEGDFVNGQRDGQGVMVEAGGSRYEGGFLAGKRAGIGRERYSSGQTYEGGFLDGLRSGQGVYTWPSGQRYEGAWLRGEQEGYGVMEYARGDRYAGNWSNGERQGPTEQDQRKKASSDTSGQWIAGVIGAAVIGSASGLSSAEKLRVASGLVADIATDGKAQGIQGAVTDVRTARLQSAEVQAAIAEQQRRAAQVEQQRTQAAQRAVPPPAAGAGQPVVGAENVKVGKTELYTNSSHLGGVQVPDAQAAKLGERMAGVSLDGLGSSRAVPAATSSVGSTVTASTASAGKPAGRPFAELTVRDEKAGRDVSKKVTKELQGVDGFDSPICGKVFKLSNTDEATLSFSCTPGTLMGSGTWTDGKERGEFVWGYALEDDGKKVRTKTYQEWEDPRWGKSQNRAVQIYYRYTSGFKKDKSYTTITGPQEGSRYLYMFPDHFAQ